MVVVVVVVVVVVMVEKSAKNEMGTTLIQLSDMTFRKQVWSMSLLPDTQFSKVINIQVDI